MCAHRRMTMPCFGVAVQTAQVGINFAAELEHEAEPLREYLIAQGVKGVGSVQIFATDQAQLSVQGATLSFSRNQISVRFRGRARVNGQRALDACEQYAGELL